MIRALLLAATLALVPSLPRAETLVTALSTERVSIESNFTGSGVVIFGTIERDQQTVSRGAPYEIVVTLTGPLRSMVARRKERVAGIWINRAARDLSRVPSFLAIATTAPMADVAGNPVRAKQGLGFDMLPTRGLPDALPPVRTEFDAAFFRLMQDKGLFSLDESSVEFLSPQLFRAPIALPANVPIGWYTATVYLFSGGVLLAETTQDFSILKGGFEQAITNLAHQRPALYGLATVVVACFTGWLAGVAFRKD
ncbi:MAG: putative transrane protein [Proteobacteria bacterium]|nr:putative transrane protein [Pseudomonadota bacterium]